MLKQATDQAIREAAEIIKSGGLAAFPTETVYGLGANALAGTAVAKIFEAKDRPKFNPLISHLTSLEEAEKYGAFNDRARKIARAFWPGPLTLIVPRKENCEISELASAGLATIALRVPSHPVALKLIEYAGVPIVAPSANKAGTLSPTTPAYVAQSFGPDLFVLAAGGTQVGLESTVLDLTGEGPALLRHGAILKEDIEAVLECEVTIDTEAKDNKPKSPGQLLRHYAPSIPLRLKAVDVEQGEALLAFGSVKFMGVKGGGFAKDLPPHAYKNLSETGDLYEAAANLFSYLHALDNSKNKGIAVMDIPDQGLGIAINDRLKRAAA
ncbi:MAG: threonylcarbamoyl-AMP synthase [Alphaproteobacteria bacterium]|nr:threonylcarbamoyl-AMP synthase [Alphaproteobacteria bacterium]